MKKILFIFSCGFALLASAAPPLIPTNNSANITGAVSATTDASVANGANGEPVNLLDAALTENRSLHQPGVQNNYFWGITNWSPVLYTASLSKNFAGNEIEGVCLDGLGNSYASSRGVLAKWTNLWFQGKPAISNASPYAAISAAYPRYGVQHIGNIQSANGYIYGIASRWIDATDESNSFLCVWNTNLNLVSCQLLSTSANTPQYVDSICLNTNGYVYGCAYAHPNYISVFKWNNYTNITYLTNFPVSMIHPQGLVYYDGFIYTIENYRQQGVIRAINPMTHQSQIIYQVPGIQGAYSLYEGFDIADGQAVVSDTYHSRILYFPWSKIYYPGSFEEQPSPFRYHSDDPSLYVYWKFLPKYYPIFPDLSGHDNSATFIGTNNPSFAFTNLCNGGGIWLSNCYIGVSSLQQCSFLATNASSGNWYADENSEASNFTVAVSAETTPVANNSVLASSSGGAQGQWFLKQLSVSNLWFAFQDQSNTRHSVYATNAVSFAGALHLFAATYSSSTGMETIYLDGHEIGQTNAGAGRHINANYAGVTLGVGQYAFVPLKGGCSFYDFRYYTRCLSAFEVKHLEF